MGDYIDLVRKIVDLHEIDVFPHPRCNHELINQIYKAADLGSPTVELINTLKNKFNHAGKVLPLSINRRAIFK